MKILKKHFLFCFFIFISQIVFSQSVLKNGTWARVSISESGVYKISYDDLISMGFSNPISVQIFGNGAGELSLINTVDLPSVLHEISISVEKGSDGIFNSGDYVLFYGQSPHSWDYDTVSKKYSHKNHQYSQLNYYYITTNRNLPQLIQNKVSPTLIPTSTINSFDYLLVNEVNTTNILKSGRMWFESTSSKTIDFSVPQLIHDDSVYINIKVVGKHPTDANFNVTFNGVESDDLTFKSSNGYVLKNKVYAIKSLLDNVQVSIDANFSGIDSRSYIDYCELHARCSLQMQNNQLLFQDSKSLMQNSVGTFQITSNSNAQVWDITNPENPQKITTSYSGNLLKFNADISSLSQYVAFNGYKSVTFDKMIDNQDLLSNTNVDMIIVCGDEFYEYAKQLADVHKSLDGIETAIVNQRDIFTEFSAGRPDISAIRNYFRYVYMKSGTLQYVLLFGDGSYNNTDFENQDITIMTFQSNESLNHYSSFVSDDFFGFMGSSEGVTEQDKFIGEIDIAIGRFPVNTLKQAEDVTNKTIFYMTQPKYRGEWQNFITFLADDADDNQTFHMSQADDLSKNIEINYPYFNYDKIYLDAYTQQVKGSGEKYPDANIAINERMKKGCLVFNYTGHGSEVQMTAENVLNSASIESWKNKDKLPLFITASCEIAKFDDPTITSLGEKFLLQKDGGAIALYSTTRVVFASSNYTLNNNIYKTLFSKDSEGLPITIGNAFLEAKKLIPNDFNQNKRNFTLLGDPALRLAVPEYSIIIDSINNQKADLFLDTIKANSVLSIIGHIENGLNVKDDSYNGVLYMKLFDKNQMIETLGNDDNDMYTFYSYKNNLFQGKASIVDGNYTAQIIVPHDIYYYNGKGKLSLFCTNNLIEGKGSAFLQINGSNETIEPDFVGPQISMYMGDTTFVSGKITNETPTLIVKIFDESGVNISDAAIGHTISIVIDGDEVNSYVLNEFYSADVNTYKNGTIEYPISELAEGPHSITIKVWDTQNNMSEKTIEFTVVKLSNIQISELYNFPNPFSNSTTFHFAHNQENEDLKITLRIFDISGICVKTIENTIYSDGYSSSEIQWDGTLDTGKKVSSGIYTYTVEIENSLGKTVRTQQKMIVLQ